MPGTQHRLQILKQDVKNASIHLVVYDGSSIGKKNMARAWAPGPSHFPACMSVGIGGDSYWKQVDSAHKGWVSHCSGYNEERGLDKNGRGCPTVGEAGSAGIAVLEKDERIRLQSFQISVGEIPEWLAIVSTISNHCCTAKHRFTIHSW